MGTIKVAYGVCPNCGANLKITNDKVVMYGSPVQTCKKCKGQYIDTRYQEYAISGIPEHELSVKHDLKIIAGAAIMGLICTAINTIDLRLEGKYFPVLTVIEVVSPLFIIGMIVDIIRIKTGSKAAKLEKKRLESVQRLQDPYYAQALYEAGYLVPAEYLPAQEQEASSDSPDFSTKGETVF